MNQRLSQHDSLSVMAIRFILCVCLLLSLVVNVHSTSTGGAPVDVTVSVDWSAAIGVSSTAASVQIVHNALTRPDFSPIANEVYQALSDIPAQYVRQQLCAYPHLVIAELFRPTGTSRCGTVGENATLLLSCNAQAGGVINTVEFAAFGSESGSFCPFRAPNCSAKNALHIVQDSCIGQSECALSATRQVFGDVDCDKGIPLRLSVSVTCDPPANQTYWDMTYMDPLVLATAEATIGKTSVINFCTPPQWLFPTKSDVAHFYPDNPNFGDAQYRLGRTLVDPTGNEIGAYFARLTSWYMFGGFHDEYNHYHHSGYEIPFTYYEVLNEIDHSFANFSVYVTIYDAVVAHIQAAEANYTRHQNAPRTPIKFIGLALMGERDLGYNLTQIAYFLNRSNHRPADTAVDAISLHFYAHPNDSYVVEEYEHFFTSVDIFMEHLVVIDQLVASLRPDASIFVDELGSMLPVDKNGTDTHVTIPSIFWNAAAATDAYFYRHATMFPRVRQTACSLLLGHPDFPEMQVTGMFPSLTMLNWTSGTGNARYHSLRLLLTYISVGDTIVTVNSSDTSGTFVDMSAYVNENKQRHLLAINKRLVEVQVTSVGSEGGQLACVDEFSGEGPPRVRRLSSNTWTLHPFGVCFVVYPSLTAAVTAE